MSIHTWMETNQKMSKYVQFPQAQFKDKAMLLQSLADIGWDASKIEEGPDHLYGYHGDKRPEIADIIIRRKYVGHASNDIGFKLTESGYVPIVSEYDSSSSGPLQGKFVVKLRTAYSERVVEEMRRRLHGTVTMRREGNLNKIRVAF